MRMAEISEKAVERAARAWARISEAYQAARAVVDDDRRGWLICACVLIVTVVRSGITYSFGMFVVDFEKLYHKPLAEQSETTPQTATKKNTRFTQTYFRFFRLDRNSVFLHLPLDGPCISRVHPLIEVPRVSVGRHWRFENMALKCIKHFQYIHSLQEL